MKLTRSMAQTIIEKFDIVADEPDLQDDYGITQSQADALVAGVPARGGDWAAPEWAAEVVAGELADLIAVALSGARSEAPGPARDRALRETRKIEKLTH